MKKTITKDMLEAIQIKKRHAHLVELFYSLHYAKQTFSSMMSNLKRLGPIKIDEDTSECIGYFFNGELYIDEEDQLQTSALFSLLPVTLIQEGGYVTVKEFDFLDAILDSLASSNCYSTFMIFSHLARSEDEEELLSKFDSYFFNFHESTTLMVERILSEFNTFIQIHNALSYLAKGFDPDSHYDTEWRDLEDYSLPF